MNRRTCLSLVIALILLLPMMAQAAPVGKFTSVKGSVDVTPAGGKSAAIQVGSPVSVGDIVRTKSRSSAEILFDDGSVLRLARNSRLAINEYSMGKGEDRGIMKLFRGKVQSIVKRAAGFFGNRKNRFEVHTPTAVCGVRGTNFFTWYAEGQSGAAVKEGTVYSYSVAKPAEVRDVKAGESMVVVSEEEPPVVRPATDQDLTLDEEEDDEGGLAFVDNTQTGPDAGDNDPVGTPSVDDGNTSYIPPTVADTESFTLFSADLAGGFLAGTLDGEVSDTDNTGTIGIAGTFSGDALAPQTAALGGEMSDGGAFAGYLGGVAGSWEGVFSSLYINASGGAGYLFGTLSGELNGGSLNAGGAVERSGVKGTAIPTVDGGTYSLAASIEEWAHMEEVLPVIGTRTDADMSEIYGIELDGGRHLGVWRSTTSGAAPIAGRYLATGNSGTIAYEGGELLPWYMAGYLEQNEPATGHLAIEDFGTLTYMDHHNLGTVNLWHRGTKDGDTYRGVTAGTFTLDPLNHVSDVGAPIEHAVRQYSGKYYKDPGSGTYAYYQYTYNADDSYGYQHQETNPPWSYDYKYYDQDGSTWGGGYGNWDYDSGWDPSSESLSDLAKAPYEDGTYLTAYERTGMAVSSPAAFMGLFGGTESLWGSGDARVMALGQVTDGMYGGGPIDLESASIWQSPIESVDQDGGQRTTYDGGAYTGWLSGIKSGSVINGNVLALYMDPAGNIGTLSGDMAGNLVGDEYFLLDGAVSKMRKGSRTDIAPADFAASVFFGYGGARLDGWLGTEGKVTSGDGYDGFSPSMSSLVRIGGYGGSGFETAAVIGEDWGIFSGSFFGEFTNPDTPAATTWTSTVGGMAEFGGIDTNQAQDQGRYNYSNGGYYSYRNWGSSGSAESYSIADSYYPRTYYYYGYDGSLEVTEYDENGSRVRNEVINGYWDPDTQNLSELMDNPTPPAGEIAVRVPQGNTGFWVGKTASDWGEGVLSADLSGRFISKTLMGTLSGDMLGTYSGTADGNWEAVSQGTWEGTPLAHVAEAQGRIMHGYNQIRGYYLYDNGETYEYRYDSDGAYIWTRQQVRGESSMYLDTIETSYYADGRKYIYQSIYYNDYNSNGYSFEDTWDSADFDPTDLTDLPEEGSGRWVYHDVVDDTNDRYGYVYGFFGGAKSLFAGSDVPVTFIGSGDSIGDKSVWGMTLASRNYIDGTETTYDANGDGQADGAYAAFAGGIHQQTAMPGELLGVYVDQNGNAGYLRGDMDGTEYPEIGMVAIDGTVNREFKETLSGITLTDSNVVSLWSGGFRTNGAVGTGNLTDDHDGDIYMMSVADTNWGAFGGMTYGRFENAYGSAFSATLGGYGGMGSYFSESIGIRDLGMPGTENPGYDRSTGYWIVETTGGTWSENMMDAKVNGRFMTYTLLGDASRAAGTGMTGTMTGTYDEEAGAWEAVVSGTWTGTQLAHVSDFNMSAKNMVAYQGGTYTGYSDNSYYRYEYKDGGAWAKTWHYTDSDYSGYQNCLEREYSPDGQVNVYEKVYYNAMGGYHNIYWTESWDAATDVQALIDQPAGEEGDTIVLNPGVDYDTINYSTSFNGLVGGIDSLWGSADPEILLMGTANGNRADTGVFYTQVYSRDFAQGTRTAYEGGAYSGFLGGIMNGDFLNAHLAALYMDDAGHTGFLLSDDVFGGIYREIDMFAMAGTVQRVQVSDSPLGISDVTFADNIGFDAIYIDSYGGGFYNASSGPTGGINLYPDGLGYGGGGAVYSPDAGLGAWAMTQFGSVPGGSTVTDDWGLQLSGDTHQFVVDGIEWPDAGGLVSGNVAGAWVDLDHAVTGVTGGLLKGTFDPDASTWQAVLGGVNIETSKFMELIENTDGQAILQALNVPSFEVGQINLNQVSGGIGSTGEISGVAMTGVTFFANQSGGTPAIWATDKVSGNYIDNPINAEAMLTGGGLSVNFQVNHWNSGQWGATINGDGTPTGVATNGNAMDGTAITMTGAAAGAIDKNLAGGTAVGEFSGTSAGVVTSAH
ncbi:MAG: FecR domain-containing protein [Desulfobacterales bacterium]|nr:FecR domain-containing protein [Desulfobacterales bacterium]